MGAACIAGTAASLALVATLAVPAAAAEVGELVDLEAATAIDVATGERVEALPRARIVHVVFFATWCPPCLEEWPRLADLHERWEEDGYALVTVAVSHRQSRERVADFARARAVPWRVVLDEKDVLRGLLGVDRIPAHVVLDGEGRVLARADGYGPEIGDLVSDHLQRAR